MTKYKITIDKEDLHQLFNQDQGMTKLIEKDIFFSNTFYFFSIDDNM